MNKPNYHLGVCLPPSPVRFLSLLLLHLSLSHLTLTLWSHQLAKQQSIQYFLPSTLLSLLSPAPPL